MIELQLSQLGWVSFSVMLSISLLTEVCIGRHRAHVVPHTRWKRRVHQKK
jgi:hypothetical protein